MVRSRQRGDGSCGLVWEAPFRQHLLELLPLAPLLARVAVAPGSELLQELLPRGCASGLTDRDESRHRDALGIVQGLRPLAIHNAAQRRGQLVRYGQIVWLWHRSLLDCPGLLSVL